jgi:hypothetical protein
MMLNDAAAEDSEDAIDVDDAEDEAREVEVPYRLSSCDAFWALGGY